MRLIPPSIDQGVNRGERAVYEALSAPGAAGHAESRLDTSGWTVLHSLDIAEHNRAVAGEVDFLVVAPGLGVLVLEVKGVHRVARREGVWVLGDGPEARQERRGPFKQASEAMHSLRDRLVRSRPHLNGVPFWSAVCFPFLDFGEPSEEWHSWQVIDRRAMQARPLAELLARVLENGRRHMAEHRVTSFDVAGGEPTPEQCREIVAAMRPDFELYESPRSRARRIDDEIRRYTEEQFGALDAMERNPRVIFDGPAGTGKTLLAIEAARRAAAAGRRVLFLCFNVPLRMWLADQMNELRPAGMPEEMTPGLALAAAAGSASGPAGGREATGAGTGPGVVVRSLHEHMLYVAGMDAGGRDADSSFWLNELSEAAAFALLEQQERCAGPGSGDGASASVASAADAPTVPANVFDEIVVDEAQDILNKNYIEFLDLCVRGGLGQGVWRIFGDFEYQRIYREHGSMTLNEFDPDGRWPVHELSVNCRNTPTVAGLACSCVGVDPSHYRVLRSDEEDEPPEIRSWQDEGAQTELLTRSLDELHAAGYAWGDIAALSTVADKRSACARLSGRQPWADRLDWVVQYSAGLDMDEWRRSQHQTGARVRCATIHRFKGLEARAVVITDVTALDDNARALLYVGATRCVERLIILAERDAAAELRKLAKAASGSIL